MLFRSRRALLAAERPDLQFVELRGNIQTRLSKLPEGGALVMAVAALQILGLTDRIAEALEVDRMVPAPGQGCVAIECRAGDAATAALLAAVDHAPTREAVTAERAFLAELGTGCSLPVAVHAERVDGDLLLHGFLADPATGRTARAVASLAIDPAERLSEAATVARDLQAALAAGGAAEA